MSDDGFLRNLLTQSRNSHAFDNGSVVLNQIIQSVTKRYNTLRLFEPYKLISVVCLTDHVNAKMCVIIWTTSNKAHARQD